MKKLFEFEWKKILLKQKGGIILLAFVLLQILVSLGMSANVNLEVEENKAVFRSYETLLSGQPSVEKESYLAEEYDLINNAPIELDNLTGSLKYGEITSEEYAAKVSELDELLSRKNGFNAAYNQYNSIKNDSENCWFLYTNGWNSLLTGKDWSPILLLCLLVLIVPIFCYEYSSEFENVLITTRRGREKTAYTKIVIAFAIAALAAVASGVIQYAVCAVKYGLPSPSYPLQSLGFYAASEWNLSLIQCFGILVLFRVMGSILIAALIMLFSTVTKKMISALMIMGSIAFIPVLAPLPDDLKFRLPLPYGLMTGYGFIKGDETAGEEIIFKALSKTELGIMFAVFVAVVVFCIWYLVKRYLNQKIVRKPKRMRSLSLLLLMPILLLTACQNAALPRTVDYNMNIDNRYGYYNGAVYRFEIIEQSHQLVRIDEKTGDISRVLLNPFLDFADSHIISVYQNGNLLYASYYYGNNMVVSEINLDNFNEKIILSYTFETSYDLLEMDKSGAFHQYTLFQGGSIFATNKSVFLYSDNAIYEINRLTKSFTKVVDNCIGNISFDGENVYYLGNKRQIICYNVHSGESETLSNIRTDYFYLHDGKIAYSNLNAIDEVVVYDTAAQKTVRTAHIPAGVGFAYDGTAIYYTNLDDANFMYRYSFSDGSNTRISDEICYEIALLDGSPFVYTPVVANKKAELKGYHK